MIAVIDKIKGIHPGFILERELAQRGLNKGRFAIAVGEFPQTLSAITKGKRRMTVGLSLKIEQSLEIEEGFFMVLQAYYDIEQEKLQVTKDNHPDLSKIRPVTFWDTDINSVNWQKSKKAVIQRVFERGNRTEIEEIIKFYGEDVVIDVLKTIPISLLRSFEKSALCRNAAKYMNLELISDGK